jgi:hypothetical protein
MLTILNIVLVLFAGVVLAVLCIITGAWVVFKAKTAGPGTPFIGRPPKGEVFVMPDAEDAEDFPGQEAKTMLSRTEAFLSKIGGAK